MRLFTAVLIMLCIAMAGCASIQIPPLKTCDGSHKRPINAVHDDVDCDCDNQSISN